MPAGQMGLPPSLHSHSCAAGSPLRLWRETTKSQPLPVPLCWQCWEVCRWGQQAFAELAAVWSKGYLKRTFTEESKSMARLKSCC